MLIWLKMIKDIAGHPEDEIRQWDESKGQRLIDGGFAVKVDAPVKKPEAETATLEPVGETAEVTPRKRGRPPLKEN